MPVNDVICRLPHLFGDNRLMHIHAAFVNGIPQNPCYGFLFPVIPVILAARIMLRKKLLLVIARLRDFPLIQYLADTVRPIPFQSKAVYQPDSGRSHSHEFAFQCPYALSALDFFGNIP